MRCVYKVDSRDVVPANEELLDMVGYNDSPSPDDLDVALIDRGFKLMAPPTDGCPFTAFVREPVDSGSKTTWIVIRFDDPLMGLTYYAMSHYRDYLWLIHHLSSAFSSFAYSEDASEQLMAEWAKSERIDHDEK